MSICSFGYNSTIEFHHMYMHCKFAILELNSIKEYRYVVAYGNNSSCILWLMFQKPCICFCLVPTDFLCAKATVLGHRCPRVLHSWHRWLNQMLIHVLQISILLSTLLSTTDILPLAKLGKPKMRHNK